jgi:hypothetical protein
MLGPRIFIIFRRTIVYFQPFLLLYLFEVGSITKKWMGCWKETLTDADNFAISFPEEMELPNKERHQLYRNYSLKPTGFLVCVPSEAFSVQYLCSVLRIRCFYYPWIWDPYPGFGMEKFRIRDLGSGMNIPEPEGLETVFLG